MVQPIQYVTPGAFDPFGNLMQGLRLGATVEEMQAVRQQREMQQQALQQQATQQQARQAELAQLQAIPFDQMTQPQTLRLFELTNSEATRAYLSRAMEAMPAAQKAARARDYGSTLIALGVNPEIGIRRLSERAEVETDPAQKKAIEDTIEIAKTDPKLAAKMLHGTMSLAGGDFAKISESAVKYLENAGSPLYPKAVPPKEAATIVSTDADKVRLGLVENGKPLPGVWAIEPGKAPQQLRPEVARAVGGAGGGAGGAREERDDPRKIVAREITDAAGNVTLLNKFGEVITPSAPVRGKPSATFEKTTAQRKQLAIDLDRTIVELTNAAKKGGLIDQSTGSGIGRAIDVGAAFIGEATPGAIAIGRLQPIADMVLKMVPRFEGPQSDKDTQSYKEAAGQLANPALPTKIRKDAALEIVRLMKERKNQFVTDAMASEGVGAGQPPAPAPAAAGTVDRNNPLLK
jgi:hypothetical protein